jgi:hypothetical protein
MIPSGGPGKEQARGRREGCESPPTSGMLSLRIEKLVTSLVDRKRALNRYEEI